MQAFAVETLYKFRLVQKVVGIGIVSFLGISVQASEVNLAKLNYEQEISIDQKILIPGFPRYTVDSSDYLPKKLDKKDIFISGTTVSIDDPIKSFGGDVTIVANKVFVNAPIDTRTYFKYDRAFWVNYHYHLPGTDRSDFGDLSYFHYAAAPFKKTPVTQAFADLLYWHDYYDPDCKCYKYKSISIDEQYNYRHGVTKPTQVPRFYEFSVPILPYGLTPQGGAHYDTTPILNDGFDAPEVELRETYKSGNITIYANKIEFCKTCNRSSTDEKMPAYGDEFDKEWKRFLITSGIKGGRGGAGHPAGCYEIITSNTPFCRDKYNHKKGGMSGQPGKGADGGDIEIVFFSGSPQLDVELEAAQKIDGCSGSSCDAVIDEYSGSIAALSMHSGGPPSHTYTYRTPSINDLKNNTDSNYREDFASQSRAEKSVNELTGAAGQLSIRSMLLHDVILEVAVLLDSADIDSKYKRFELLDCLYVNSTTTVGDDEFCEDLSIAVNSPLIRNFLTTYLIENLNERQSELLDKVRTKFVYGRDISNFESGDILNGLSCRVEEMYNLNELERQTILRLCQFRQFGTRDLINSYFFRTGGMFNPTQISSVPDLQLERAVVGINRLGEILIRMERELKETRKILYDRHSQEYLSTLLSHVTRIQNILLDLNEKLQGATGMEEFSLLVAEAGQDISKAISSYTAQDYVSGTVNLFKAFKSIDKIFDFVNSKEADEIREEILKYESELYDAQVSLVRGHELVKQYKDVLTLEGYYLISEYLKQLRLVNSSRINLLFEFDNLLAKSMVMHAGAPMRSTHHFPAALNSIDSFFDSFPYNPTSFVPVSQNYQCTPNDFKKFDNFDEDELVRCVVLDRNKNTYGIFPKFGGRRFSGIPLVIVETGVGTAHINLFGVFKKRELASRVVYAVGNRTKIVD